jgi:hypothetical protein
MNLGSLDDGLLLGLSYPVDFDHPLIGWVGLIGNIFVLTTGLGLIFSWR